MSLPLSFVLLVLAVHWIGDYLFQTNAIADHKGKSLLWLGLHVLIYSLTLIVFAFFVFTWQKAFQYVLINGVFHFITDLLTSKLHSRFRNNPRIFYPVMGFDQLIHTVTLVSTGSMLLVSSS